MKQKSLPQTRSFCLSAHLDKSLTHLRIFNRLAFNSRAR